ncbi:MAG TPA: cytochrome P450 [Candidatus Binataceae bacterium]|nr:cytochrome P450 [Candidatus Binataceae bacterium]
MELEQIDLASLDLFVDGDPHAAWKLLRAKAPVHWNQHRNSGFWSISRYHDGLEIYCNPTDFSSENGIVAILTDKQDELASSLGFRKMLIFNDPPRHTRMRQLVNRRFTPRALAPLERMVRSIAVEILDAIAPSGRCDFVLDVASRLPTAVICEMMGIPKADRDLMFSLANMSIGSQDPEYQIEGDGRRTGQHAQKEYFDYLGKLVDQRRNHLGDDLVSAVIAGEMEGQRLSASEVVFNTFLFVVAGQETTRNAISGGMLALLRNPSERDRLMRDRSLMPTAIEEILRYVSPVTHIMRTAKRDVVMHGQRIRAGERVVIWNASANRDERVFPDPDRFDVGRAPNEHLAFGYGEHYCLGANLARLEAKVIIEEVLARLPDMALAGEVSRLRSHFVAGIKHMPVRFSPA